MRDKPKGCIGCPLASCNGGFSIPDGIDWRGTKLPFPSNNGVLIIGEALGEQEKKLGSPFVVSAESGSTLQAAFNLLNLSREDFGIYNIVACQPPKNKLAGRKDEVEIAVHCSRYLDQVVAKFNPKVILALGNIPLKYLTEFNGIAKEKQGISLLRGYKLWSEKYQCIVVPSLHPSFITQMGRVYLGVLKRDISAALAFAKGTIPEFKYNYKTNPSPAELEEFIARLTPDTIKSYDIETPTTAISGDETEVEYEVREVNSIQISTKAGEGIYLDWNDNNLPYIKRILGYPCLNIGWNNWSFDNVNLRYALGADAIGGETHDMMSLWKHYNSDFSRMGGALQFATNYASPEFPPWKHIAQTEPAFYGTLDVDAVRRIYDWLVPITRHIRFKSILGTDQPEYSQHHKSVYQGWIDDVVKIRPILDDMSARGLPFDIEAKDKFKAEVRISMAKSLKEAQEIYPKDLLTYSPINGYVKIPKEVHQFKYEFEKTLNPKNKLYVIYENVEEAWWQFLEENTRIPEKDLGGLGLYYITEKLTAKQLEDRQKNLNREFEPDIFQRYARRKAMKPNSSLQIKKYVEAKGHKMPKSVKGDDESTSKDVMLRMAATYGDPFYTKVNQYRELRKLMSTYLLGYERAVGADGRIHSTFTFGPATGQLASVKPNVMNMPARGNQFSSPEYNELAKRFKSLIKAKEGHTLVEVDYSSFHALTLGFEAEDEDYMKLVRSDIHSYIAGFIIRAKARHKYDNDLIKGRVISESRKLIMKRLSDLENWVKLDEGKLRGRITWLKNASIPNFKGIRNSQAKPAILGMGFGLGAKKLYRMNQESFDSVKDVEYIFAVLHKLFPKIFKKYQPMVRQMADVHKRLVSRSGGIRHFYDVFDRRILKYDRSPKPDEIFSTDSMGRTWVTSPGQQAEAAIAYLPANDAFSRIKEAMRRLEEIKINETCRFILQMHDALIFECPNALVDYCIYMVQKVMEAPSKILFNNVAPDGLVCKTEAKIGISWGEMKDYVETN